MNKRVSLIYATIYHIGLAGYSTFDTIPTTFLLTAGQEDTEWAEFNARYRDISKGFAPKERIPIKHCVNNIWLVKPSNAN